MEVAEICKRAHVIDRQGHILLLIARSQGQQQAIDGCSLAKAPPSMMQAHQTSTPVGAIGSSSSLRAPQPCACGRFATASAPLFASPAQPVRRPQRQCSLRVASTSLDDLSLFQGGSAMPSTSGSTGREAAVKIEDVPLNSEVRRASLQAHEVWCRSSAGSRCSYAAALNVFWLRSTPAVAS